MLDNNEYILLGIDGSKGEDSITHYGTKHKSGRYPWGSGENPFQHDPNYTGPEDFKTAKEFYDEVSKMKKEGLKDSQIAKMLGMSTGDLRTYTNVAGVKIREENRAKALVLRNQGLSHREIAKAFGLPESKESTIRQWLDDDVNSRRSAIFALADRLKKMIDEKGPIDVGKGVELDLDTTTTGLDQALAILAAEYGYSVDGVGVTQQLNKGQQTILRVAGPPEMKQRDLYHIGDPNYTGFKIPKLATVKDYGPNEVTGEKIMKPKFSPPTSIARNRVLIKYGNDGSEGKDKDGVIELRPGVPDLSLSGSHYSQVRIMVDNEKGDPSYYLKGMAVYSDNVPDGYDIVFNSSKPKEWPDDKVFKELKRRKDTGEVDWEDPFGANIKEAEKGGQYWYVDENGNEKLGAINKRADEGDWDSWASRVPSQFLSKQDPKLIKQQLSYTIADKKADLEEIMSLTNPAVREKMLKDFAGTCDTQAKHLYAASFPRQSYNVILPVNSLKDNEIYAPTYKNGETLALIRFPHAGTFELPILKVNNNNPEGHTVVGTDPIDAVGINGAVARRLSGADYDGDTVLTIPVTDKVHIKSTKPLEGLAQFTEDFHDIYAPIYKLDKNGNQVIGSDGKPVIASPVMSKKLLQKQMGVTTNLITDMTLAGASPEELVRAVKHSMVVVDSPKHKLNYKLSEVENGIAELKNKYQLHSFTDPQGNLHANVKGASTILTRAKSEARVPKLKGYTRIDPETGKIIPTTNIPDTKEKILVKETKDGKEYIKTGEIIQKTNKTAWMDYVDDATELVRDPNNAIEMFYANYANSLKALANEARKEAVIQKKLEYNPEARKKYANEVASLTAKYNETLKAKPRERQANVLMNGWWKVYLQEHDAPDNDEAKKIKTKMLRKAREIVGAQRVEINITDEEWEAIQAGAISHNRLMDLLGKVDQDRFIELAMPREKKEISQVKINQIQSMLNSGYTIGDVAERTKLSKSTIVKYMKEGGNV